MQKPLYLFAILWICILDTNAGDGTNASVSMPFPLKMTGGKI